MNRWIACGAVNGFIAVATGAFAAHGLRDRLEPRLLEAFETGARYQMYHALALVLLGLYVTQRPGSALANSAAWAMTAGVVLFSGSLYTLAVSGVRIIGIITPFGGVAFLVGWALFFASAIRDRPS